MSKTSVFTTITPLPAGITRQSVLETYHNHTEMIELNPLVIEKFKCKAPNYAPAEEFYSTWYTIKDKVSYLPGGLATGSVSYHACFHDLPDGLQTHVYAPLGLDIRAKWSVGGNLPGEPKAPVELGLGAPREGLYIREDVKMKCNIMMISFVKKTFKESHSKLVDRLVEKAHRLEAKAANERLAELKSLPPGQRMGEGQIPIAPPQDYQPHHGHLSTYSASSGLSPLNSPGLAPAHPQPGQNQYHGSPQYQQVDPRMSYQLPPSQQYDPRLSYSHDAGYGPNYQQSTNDRPVSVHPAYGTGDSFAAELPSEAPQGPTKDGAGNRFTAELPG